ncbi:hypothetical protein NO135_22405, partial [Clostridioides difficile]|nr:hypothetical protein [Clostridioides difficile]
YHRPANRCVAGFIGSPRMNFLPATVASNDPDACRLVLDGTGERLVLRGRALPRGMAAGTPLTLGIRPEHLAVGTGAAPDAPSIVRE